MNAKQFAATCRTLASLMAQSDEATALVKFATVFDGLGDAKAVAVAAQIAKNWKTDKRVARRPVVLLYALRQLGGVFDAPAPSHSRQSSRRCSRS